MVRLKANGELIALSDGHGVDTSGKRTPVLPNGQKSEIGRNYMNENLFNRAVVNYLEKELLRHGFKVLQVAPTDADTPLATRTNLANSKNADLYLSIHANALNGQWGTHGGIETFVSKSSESIRIGNILHNEVMKGTHFKNRGVKDGTHLWEIKSPKMPSVLVELGFMDSVDDYKHLLSDIYRRECATELCKGICLAFNVQYQEEKKEEKPMTENKTETTLPTTPASWAKEAWDWAKKEGFLDGTRPYETITRQEMAVLVKRIVDYKK